jgi:hypothetical protein
MDTQFQVDLRVAGTVPDKDAQAVQKLLAARLRPRLSRQADGQNVKRESQNNRHPEGVFKESSLKYHGSLATKMIKGQRVSGNFQPFYRNLDGE